MAPEGKNSLIVMLESDFEYWNELAKDRSIYLQKKDEVAGLLSALFVCGQLFRP